MLPIDAMTARQHLIVLSQELEGFALVLDGPLQLIGQNSTNTPFSLALRESFGSEC
jgi:hypothetical protein